MARRRTGQVRISTVFEETVRAFVPLPLPPSPALELLPADRALLDRAHLALGRLDGVAGTLPDPDLFLSFYVRKEALLSSQIEGTQSSFADLILFEGEGSSTGSIDDVTEVVNYTAAMNHGLRRLDEGFPLSNRLLREIHGVLLREGCGSERDPGEFRRSQNWIGGTRPGNALFVPPPPEMISELMGDLERYLHADPVDEPTLIKAALAHYQFETIHPFLDGNGRLGRLLVTLLLCSTGILSRPALFLSLYLKEHRDEYYRLLQRARTDGELEQWVRFFVEGVVATANQAHDSALALRELVIADRRAIAALGRAAGSALRVHDVMQRQPIIGATRLSQRLEMSLPAILNVLARLIELGIVDEVTGRSRNRLFSYRRYLAILDSGTEPLSR